MFKPRFNLWLKNLVSVRGGSCWSPNAVPGSDGEHTVHHQTGQLGSERRIRTVTLEQQA